jgi:hypothetical protein
MSTRFPVSALKWWCCLALLNFAVTPLRAATVSQTVAKARRNYGHIERNLEHFKRMETDLSGYSTEGGTLVAYFHDGAVRKLIARYFGEAGQATEEYYFAGGRLFFVLRTELRYDKPLSAAAENKRRVGTAASRLQTRSYFADGRLVRWVDQSGKARPADKEFTTQERETLAQARRLLSSANALLN